MGNLEKGGERFMRVKAKRLDIRKALNGDTELTFSISDKNNKLLNNLSANKTLQNSELELAIDKWRDKRSRGHNALFWDMCKYLSDHINDPLITPLEIYKSLIHDYGQSTIHPVRNEDVDLVIKDWTSRGDGWLVETQKSKLQDCTNVKLWFGSSRYNSKEFYRLVEGLKQMCKEYDLDISHYDASMKDLLKKQELKEKSVG